MRSVLNGPLETGIRILNILVVLFPKSIDVNQLVLLDHALLHSADFGGPESLHPPVPIRSSELGIKRQQVMDGLETLVRFDLAKMNATVNGVTFAAGEEADRFLKLLSTDYAHALSTRAFWAIQRFENMTDQQLRDELRAVSGRWTEEFDRFQTVALEDM